MIRITGYLHRDILDDIIRRWMYGEVRPDDGDVITRLIHFNNLFVCRYLRSLSAAVFGEIHGEGRVSCRSISRKGILKDALIVNPPYRNGRIDELIAGYLRHPGHFYRETPFHGVLVYRDGQEGSGLVGSFRLKRARRLAEKMARRVADRVFVAIRRSAETLADERALRIGVLRHQLITPPDEMASEFQRAEEAFLDDLKHRRPLDALDEIVINDVAGIKVVWEEASLERLEGILARAGCEIVEHEEHRGRYNAVNLIVRYRPPRHSILAHPLRGRILGLLAARGWDAEGENRAFTDFVATGEDDVYVEIIVSTYENLLESEIGICMHEDRIMAQRAERPYRSHVARNIGYLLEYLFTLPEAPPAQTRDVPIRLWDRYLPDTFFEFMKELFKISSPGPQA